MAGEVAKLWVFLGLKTQLTNDVAKEIKGVQKELRGVKTISDTMINAGKALTLGLTVPIGAAAAAMGKLASDSIETENLYRVSVGSMAAQFDKFVNETSRGLGINRYELMRTAGTFNVMLTSMGLTTQKAYEMSTGFTKLAYDMASFYNLPIDEAIQKLQSGLAGEVEPLRRLGIVVDENTVKTYAYTHGIAAQGEQLTNAQKVMARYGLIMEQTTKAQGDLARTADSPANAMRRLQQEVSQLGADLGRVFIPAVAAGTRALGSLVGALANSGPAVKGFVVGIGGFLATIGPVVLGINLWRKSLYTLAPAIRAVEVALGLAKGALMPWLGIAMLATGAIVGIVNAVRAHNEQLERNKQLTGDLTQQLKDVRAQLADTNLPQEARNALLEQEKTILDQLSDLLPKEIGQRDEEGKIIHLTTEELDAHNRKLKEEEIAHNKAAIAAAEHRKAELELQRAQAWETARKNAEMNAAPIDPNDLAILQSYDEEIQSLDKDIASLTKRNEELANSLSGDDKKKPPPLDTSAGKVVTALDRLRRELEIVRVEGELMRKELGIVDGTMEAARFDVEQLNRELEAQSKIVHQAAKEYEALARSKGLAADATREALLLLKQEQVKYEEIKAQIEEERKKQMEQRINAAASGGAMLDAMRISMFGSMEAYRQAVSDMARSMGVDLSVAGAMVDAQAMPRWQQSGFKMPPNVTVNIYSSDAGESLRGTTRALEQAGLVGGR